MYNLFGRMFKKRDKRANLRRIQDDEEDEGGDGNNEESGPSIQTPTSVQKKRKKGASADAGSKSAVLSFGDGEDDGEGETFQIKRSAHSRKAIQQFKSKGARKTAAAGAYTQVSAAGSYSKEALEELRSQSSVPTRGTESTGVSTQAEATSEERHDEAVAYAVSSAIKSTETGSIPSAELIHLARKRREKARKTGEFLPLDDTVRAGGGNQSRMMREDENDRSDGEDGLEFLNFSDVSRKTTRKQQRTEMEAAMMECSNRDKEEPSQPDSHDEDDDTAAIRRWEEQQMTSAASGRHLGTAARIMEQRNVVDGLEPGSYGPSQYGKRFLAENGMAAAGSGSSRYSTETPVLSANQLPPILGSISAGSVLSSLDSKHRELEEIVVTHEGQLSRATEDFHLSEKSEESLERQMMDATERYNFFQETSGYVRDLLTCLTEKVSKLFRKKLWKVAAVSLLAHCNAQNSGVVKCEASDRLLWVLVLVEVLLDNCHTCVSVGLPVVHQPHAL